MRRENVKRLLDMCDGIEFEQILEDSAFLTHYGQSDVVCDRYINLYKRKDEVDTDPETIKYLQEIQGLVYVSKAQLSPL